jgi:hypothetical protein
MPFASVKRLFLYLFTTISRIASVPVPPNCAFVIIPSIDCHSHSILFQCHNPANQIPTFFQINQLSATLAIDHRWYLALQNILVITPIGSLYEGHIKYRSRFSNHLFEVFQAFFRFGQWNKWFYSIPEFKRDTVIMYRFSFYHY